MDMIQAVRANGPMMESKSSFLKGRRFGAEVSRYCDCG